MKKRYIPAYSTGVGFAILQAMTESKLTKSETAKKLGLLEKELDSLLSDKHRIGTPMANKLSNAFGSSPKFWSELDSLHRLRLVSILNKSKKES